jgi:DNA-directed RNA polymerase III subunit RPC3
MLTYIKRELVVRINYEKCTVALRNLRLVDLANSRIGETTSQVYAELLRLLEERIPRCRPDPHIDSMDIDDLPDGPTITTVELAAGMSTSIDIGAGIGKAPGDRVNTSTLLKMQKSARRRSHGESEAEVEDEASPDEDESDDGARQVNGYGNGNGNLHRMGDESDNAGEGPENGTGKAPKRAKVTFQDSLPRPPEPDDRSNVMAQLKNHLLLLAADECHFLRRCGSRGQGEWTVDFERLVHFLQQLELDSIILENFGTAGHRLARMMRTIGKMDEKLLSTLALMKQKDVRTKLAEMQMAGMADIQEVPKDATRANNRTIFLWYFDSERITSVILRNIYKAISRCFQRLEVEKRRASGILSLTERSDVKDNTEDALTGEQLNMLRQIRSKEDKLLGQISRLDELIGTYRDF